MLLLTISVIVCILLTGLVLCVVISGDDDRYRSHYEDDIYPPFGGMAC